jgi:type I restriction-modification system DNA methylase subunit
MKRIYEMNYEEISNLINKYLNIRTYEKKKYGEVFTPIELINIMLDKLPRDVWLNHKLKWLDPSAGIGNFIIIIYLRLMENFEVMGTK